MYKGYDVKNGLPSRIYRHPDEIRSDIHRITESIEETNSMLNIRSLLIDILVSERADSPENLVSDLEEAIFEARGALSRLCELNEELCMLEEELGDVRCLI